jgi:pilus assembly protein Flp/PilA
MKPTFSCIISEEDGQGMVEYGIIIVGIAVAAMVGILVLGPQLSDSFTNVGTQMAS